MFQHTNRDILLEVCIGSAEGAAIAESAGADRVELCSALLLGGLTPSAGMLQEARTLSALPIMAMVRPRSGGFCYSDSEFRVMLRDAEIALESGADGIVFGVLTASGEIDVPRNNQLAKIAGEKQSVFHRAFDVVPDPFMALEQLIDIGITRILTSGQEANAYNGATCIGKLIEQAAGRIEILVGGGVNRFTLDDILERTGCRQVHIAAQALQHDSSTKACPHVHFGGALRPSEEMYPLTDAKIIESLTLAKEIAE